MRSSGLRKVCPCPRRVWAKCPHPWHVSFMWKGVAHRFSLDKHLGRHVESKTEADAAAEQIRLAIREGTFGQPVPVRDRLTLLHLFEVYTRERLAVQTGGVKGNDRSVMQVIASAPLRLPTGETQAFGEWLVVDVTSATLEQFRTVRSTPTPQTTEHGVRLVGGPVGVNRALGFLRRVCNWAILAGHLDASPFKRGTVTAVKLPREAKRTRRLHSGEDTPLLAACGPHLRAVVECALETGMRRGEILQLRWIDVQDGAIHLQASATKTRTGRTIPISARLRAVLAMRRHDPAGEPLPPESFVFGTEIGSRIADVGRAWDTAILKSHGHTPTYTATANLSAESRAALQTIDLHFHDLRREAGSRWLEGGVPLHIIRDWMGHTSIAQTSTYLAGTMTTQHNAMAQFDATRLQKFAKLSGTGGRKSPQNATRPEKTPNKTADGREPTIM